MTENGENIAKEKSKLEELQDFDIVFSSSYVRAIATAKYFSKDKINIVESFDERKFEIDKWEEMPENFGQKQFNDFDVIYMMGGNTFYLLDIIRKTNFEHVIKEFIDAGKIYIGSSAGSEILGNSIDAALGYDENNVVMTDFTGLNIVDGLIIPHCNKKEDFVKKLKKQKSDKLYLLYDGDVAVI